MLVKSLITGTVLTLLSAGVVYFGTSVNPGETRDKLQNIVGSIPVDLKNLTAKINRPSSPTDLSAGFPPFPSPPAVNNPAAQNAKNPAKPNGIIPSLRRLNSANLNPKANHTDIHKTLDLVANQIDKISIPDLQDSAYLDLISFALEHNQYGHASFFTVKIRQVELRDTARNRIAIDYAQKGEIQKAFTVLEQLEVEALRDIMRAQVIQAITKPGSSVIMGAGPSQTEVYQGKTPEKAKAY